jgi:hypothetical protein
LFQIDELSLLFDLSDLRKAEEQAQDALTVIKAKRYLSLSCDIYNALNKEDLNNLHYEIDMLACKEKKVKQFIDEDDKLGCLFQAALNCLTEFEYLFSQIAKETCGEFVMGPLKDVGRVIQKIDLEYSDETFRALNDLKDSLNSTCQKIDILISFDRISQAKHDLLEMKKVTSSYIDKITSFESKCEQANALESSLNVVDIVRGSLIFNSLSDMVKAVKSIRLNPNITVVRVKNQFENHLRKGGYKDIKLNVSINGHICEMQLHLRQFWKLRTGQHDVYEKMRVLPVPNSLNLNDQIIDKSPSITEALKAILKRKFKNKIASCKSWKDEEFLFLLIAYCKYVNSSASFIGEVLIRLSTNHELFAEIIVQLLLILSNRVEDVFLLEKAKEILMNGKSLDEFNIPPALLSEVYREQFYFFLKDANYDAALKLSEENILLCKSQFDEKDEKSPIS